MKTKLEMAHDYAMKHIQEGWDINYDVLVVAAWQYADAMQAEADKREKQNKDEFYANLADPMKKVREQKWQPDWSQAPKWATHFFCERDEDDQLNGYFTEDERGISIDFDIRGFDGYGRVCSCKTFNYQGDWQDSLRKRPQ